MFCVRSVSAWPGSRLRVPPRAAATVAPVPAGVPAREGSTPLESLLAHDPGYLTPQAEFGGREWPNFLVEELVRSIGADEAIDYTREDIADGTRRYDVIFDTAGNRDVSDLRRILTLKGTLVLAGGEGGGRWLGMGRVMKAKAISPFVGQRMTNFLGRAKTEDLIVLKDLIEAGKVKPVIGARYPLSDVPEAIGELGTGHGRARSSSPCEVPTIAGSGRDWARRRPDLLGTLFGASSRPPSSAA
jgi:Zinc-binding dehydrogenase